MPAQYDTIAFRVDKNLRAYLEKEKGDRSVSSFIREIIDRYRYAQRPNPENRRGSQNP